MEGKTEADSNDIARCSHDDKPNIGMFCYSLQSDISCSLCCFAQDYPVSTTPWSARETMDIDGLEKSWKCI